MSAVTIESPIPIFTDADGTPLENGYIYIGVANLNPVTNPLATFFDPAFTIPAVQPIRTLNGFPVYLGTPTKVYVNNVDYSIQILNKSGSLVFNAASGVVGVLPVAQGGTGTSTPSLIAGSNITITGAFPNQTIASTASGGSSTISNDTSTATNLFPLFSSVTSGTASNIFTSNSKLLYQPSTGEFQASIVDAANGIYVNNQTVSVSYTIASGNSAMSSGPITIASGQTVTVSSGCRWVVL
jgi:hypothetical protein